MIFVALSQYSHTDLDMLIRNRFPIQITLEMFNFFLVMRGVTFQHFESLQRILIKSKTLRSILNSKKSENYSCN